MATVSLLSVPLTIGGPKPTGRRNPLLAIMPMQRANRPQTQPDMIKGQSAKSTDGRMAPSQESSARKSHTSSATTTPTSTPPLPPLPPAEKLSVLVQTQAFVSQPVVAAFCAGGVAGAVSRTVVSPLERLKILFQIQSAGRDAYKLSVGKALAKMWREEGWRGFMRGNGTNCIRIVPYSAVQFGSYNFYKRVSGLDGGGPRVRGLVTRASPRSG